MTRQIGHSINIYLSLPLGAWVEQQALAAQQTVPGWVRDRLLELAPPDIHAAARAQLRGNEHKPFREAVKPGRPAKEKPVTRDTEAEFLEMVEAHRDRVLDLDAKAYTENQIAGIAKVPFKVVQHILTTKAQPKRRPR